MSTKRNRDGHVIAYPREFRIKAVSSVCAGVSVSQVARDLAIPGEGQSLYGWLKECGISGPYGPGYTKPLPEHFPAWEFRGPTPGRAPHSQHTYDADFRRRAVRALAMAIEEGQANPVQAVAKAIGVGVTTLRDFARQAGLTTNAANRPGSKKPRALDYEGLRALARGKQPKPKPTPSLPAVQSQRVDEAPRERPVMNGEALSENEQLRRENGALRAKIAELMAERETFISAATILGQDRRRST